MEFSAGWKSIWTIGSVFPAPLLISGDSAEALGPLLFRPAAARVTLLPSLGASPASPDRPSAPALHDSVDAFHRSFDQFIPFSVLSSTARDDDQLSSRFSERFSPGNALQTLKCRNGDLLLLFRVGDNYDEIGGVIFSGDARKDSRERLQGEEQGSFFRLSRSLGHRILRISAQSRVFYPSSSSLPVYGFFTEGFLLACTSYSAHWYRVDTKDTEPVLVHLAYATFRNHISHACLSPHLPEESAIILENGELRLFDLNSCIGSLKLPLRLHGRAIARDLGRFGCDDSEGAWWSCDFSWHPRVFIVACGNVVLLIDSRGEDVKTSVIAHIEICDSIRLHSLESDRFVAFCKSSFDAFQFVVASNYYLLLFDTRQPLMPILQWDHCIYNPRHIEIHKLSDLRPAHGELKWASDSGFAIFVGSFRDCEFSVFCYGPHPNADSSLDCPSLVYAWELPSELTLLGKGCSCSVCIIQKEFSVEYSDQENKLSGFCIVASEELLPLSDQGDGYEGFGLVKLFSSGKLEYQSYKAVCSFSCVEEEVTSDSENLPLEREGQPDEILTRFKNFDLRYLLGYLNGGSYFLDALRMQKKLVSEGVVKNCIMPSCTEASRELVSGLLESAGVKVTGSALVVDAINKITIPSSIYEVACGRLWTNISMDLLQFAFFRESDLVAGQGRVMHFLDVPCSPVIEFPPFFLRLPSTRSEKLAPSTSKRHALIGPVLPLPILLALRQMGGDKGSRTSQDKLNGYSVEMEVHDQCEKLFKACENRISSETSDTQVQPAVSLSDDDEAYFGSQESQGENRLFFHTPQADCMSNTACFGGFWNNRNRASTASVSPNNDADRKFDVFVSRVHKRSPALGDGEKDLLEQFDDLCPVKLSFGAAKLVATPEEAKIYKCLMRQFSQWQGRFKPYENYAPRKMNTRVQ